MHHGSKLGLHSEALSQNEQANNCEEKIKLEVARGVASDCFSPQTAPGDQSMALAFMQVRNEGTQETTSEEMELILQHIPSSVDVGGWTSRMPWE